MDAILKAVHNYKPRAIPQPLVRKKSRIFDKHNNMIKLPYYSIHFDFDELVVDNNEGFANSD